MSRPESPATVGCWRRLCHRGNTGPMAWSSKGKVMPCCCSHQARNTQLAGSPAQVIPCPAARSNKSRLPEVLPGEVLTALTCPWSQDFSDTSETWKTHVGAKVGRRNGRCDRCRKRGHDALVFRSRSVREVKEESGLTMSGEDTSWEA
jgi:hypothetical protein